MKSVMSGLDLRAIANELEAMVGAHCKKCYQPHYEQVVLRLRARDGGNTDLVLVRGKRIYTSKRDRPMPQYPAPFAMVLRKSLTNARLKAIEQIGFDRVLRFVFENSHGKFHLYVEVFRDGNIILTDGNDIIIQPLTHATYADRTLKKGIEYCPPPAAQDPYDLDFDSFSELMKSSDRNLGRTLGGVLNLGGGISAAVCSDSGHTPETEIGNVDLQKVWDALNALLHAEWKGYLFLNEGGYEQAWPLVLSTLQDQEFKEYATMCEAVDEWMGLHDAHALARREAEALDIAAPGRGHSTDVERLERRLAQQEKALSGFGVKVEKQQAMGHLIQENWTHVEQLLAQVHEAVDSLGWDGVKKAVKDIEWIQSVNAAERSFNASIPDEEGKPGQQVTLNLDETVHQNAQRYFEAGRKQKDKSAGAIQALEDTKTELARAKKKQAKREASGQVARVKRAKRLWFENQKWTMLPSGHLMIGGRDAKGNDSIVKKHLSLGDRYLHADLHGAPSCSLRNNQGFVTDPQPPPHIGDDMPAFRLADKIEAELDDEITEIAATLALAWSRAWNGGGAHGTVFWVKPGQVSKSAETGEYVGKGAFVIRGQRTWYKDIDLRLGLGLVAINGIPLLMASTAEHIADICSRYVVITPGREKKEALANRIYKSTGLSVDDILPVIPGNCEIVEDVGLINFKKVESNE
ncbi:MAG: fibronectin-binding domain-containing protein [Candidatus Poseidoniales archaeon]|nr:MAG: fibronectin-binding domain-containing protein [Candidatus Poseidoniales archaeon]